MQEDIADKSRSGPRREVYTWYNNRWLFFWMCYAVRFLSKRRKMAGSEHGGGLEKSVVSSRS